MITAALIFALTLSVGWSIGLWIELIAIREDRDRMRDALYQRDERIQELLREPPSWWQVRRREGLRALK